MSSLSPSLSLSLSLSHAYGSTARSDFGFSINVDSHGATCANQYNRSRLGVRQPKSVNTLLGYSSRGGRRVDCELILLLSHWLDLHFFTVVIWTHAKLATATALPEKNPAGSETRTCKCDITNSGFYQLSYPVGQFLTLVRAHAGHLQGTCITPDSCPVMEIRRRIPEYELVIWGI